MVYLKDSTKGLESARVRVQVKRTGPNQPSINPINNAVDQITGDLDDDDASIIAIIDGTVYVPKKGGKALYELNTEIYDPSLEVVETDFEKDDIGYFLMKLPPQEAGKTITLYNLDHLSRNSRSNIVTVSDAAPNAPVVYEISNIEKSINGYVPTTSNKIYDITITIDKKKYKLQTGTNGEFSYEFEGQLKAKQVIMVTASDTKNGKARSSFSTKVVVQDIEKYVRTSSTDLTMNKVTENSYQVSGNYLEKVTIYLALTSGEGDNFISDLYTLETDEDGEFAYEIDGKLQGGTKIYAMARFADGKILLANKTEVIPNKPEKPSLLKKVTNTDKSVQVIAKRGSEITVIIGTATYKSTVYKYDEVNDRYVYTLVTDRDISGTAIQVTASNVSGKSEILTSKIVKAAPDQPKVNAIKAGDKVIKGKVELLDYTAPIEVDTIIADQKTDAGTGKTTEKTTEQKAVETQDRFKNAPAKVAQTQTRIFAQIGTKTYEGSIDKNGYFTIKIPAQVKGSIIKVWGSNKAGRGPIIKVIVVK
jgi:2',3'-cyclic-nucleotide 2'-phosphodiesterase/3'-nucleotidase